eukprot:15356877-Ditylum_brightwellii.AAC.2
MCTITTSKVNCIFAKPFIGLLSNCHHDGITATTASFISLVLYVSGSADGKVCIWDLASQSEVGHIPAAHSQMVTGLVMDLEGCNFLCGDDGHVKLWNLGQINRMFKSIDHHWNKSQFATASNSAVDMCDSTHTHTILLLQLYNDLWGSNNMETPIWYNPVESYLEGTTSADYSIELFTNF